MNSIYIKCNFHYTVYFV